MARAGAAAAIRLLDIVDRSQAVDLGWIETEHIFAARSYFRQHADQGFSFTDCTSFVIMRQRAIQQALTSDRHFVRAGFEVLLSPPR
jgi:predicted nucleic acid-binding protein